jgi:hypothetical protein
MADHNARPSAWSNNRRCAVLDDLSPITGSLGIAVENVCALTLFYSIRKPFAEVSSWLIRPKSAENSFVLS